MPLNAEHQMNILKDILSNHQSDCCGTVAECEQVERLIQSMLAKGYANTDIQATLQNVYKYTQDAKSATHLDEHIQTNQQNLSQWVQELSTLS
ncbi:MULTISPECIES: YtzH-like family protein [Priestia]|jgi:Tfp pilus assembly protein PilX|uniref:YtzH-like family protein n=1 Tax=Priestia TaxID=2800373 RepID=UPI0020423764|nr:MULTISPECIES: YtzH-like family protein [Priestia]MCM3770088.1 YtzH-like family protein [Priestia aryabhattai]MDY0939492.1 YtzH-like family protein [Priestia megaterium]